MQRKSKTIELIDNENYTPSEEEGIAEELEGKGYPARLDALDGSEHLFPRHLFNGVNYFVAFNEAQDQDFLTMACDCASFPALTTRTELTRDDIKEASISGASTKEFVQQLKDDCQRLGNLYRCVGFAHGARIFLDLANTLTHSDEEGMQALAGYFQEEAIRNYYCATILEGDAVSQQLVALILKGKTLKESGWVNDEQIAWLFRDMDDKRDQLREAAEHEIEKLMQLGNGPK